MARVILGMPYHDLSGRLNQNWQDYAFELKKIFGTTFVVISVTPLTLLNNQPQIERLRVQGFRIIENRDGSFKAEHYLNAIRGAFELADETDKILIADFDRILHALAPHHIDEFQSTVVYIRNSLADFILIQRTTEALSNHSVSLRAVERLINLFSQIATGVYFDSHPGAYAMSYRAAKHILENTQAQEEGIFTEWPILCVKSFGMEKLGLSCKVNWQSWEDPWNFAGTEDASTRRKMQREQTLNPKDWMYRFRATLRACYEVIHSSTVEGPNLSRLFEINEMLEDLLTSVMEDMENNNFNWETYYKECRNLSNQLDKLV